MSNDYALFIILLSNDFDQDLSNTPGTSHDDKTTASTMSTDTISPVSSASPVLLSVTSENEKDNKPLQSNSTKSLCVALTNYFTEKSDIEPTWLISDNKRTYQITFDVEFGFVSDAILQDLVKLGIGRRANTKVFVLPTTIILEGHDNARDESISIPSIAEDVVNHESLPVNIENNPNGITPVDIPLSRKIRKRINESNFKKSVRARLMVHQVVASIRASTVLSFDFVLLICLASMLAALGLLENSTVIIVASMLVSPLMNPILGIVFGLSVREHTLWRRGLRNELIGLIICVTWGFILGLFTTFAETSWGTSTSFPTAEMKSRGDIKRLWVGVLIALPSGAGVALSVLGGNTGIASMTLVPQTKPVGSVYLGSLVGVAISASLLPPAVNCGLLFAYSLLGASFSSVAAISSTLTNSTGEEYRSILNCSKYINNDYQPLYTCDLAGEAAILACCSLLLTIVNIICIIIMALFILRIKEVVPLHQPNKDITNFFHHDVKVARDYNKTLHENDMEAHNLATLTINRSNLAQSIVNRWKNFKSTGPHDDPQCAEVGQASSIDGGVQLTYPRDNNQLNIDTESRQKLFHLKTFAKEYDLDVFDKRDYDLLTSTSREKVQLLVSALVDMCQEIPRVFVGFFHLQPCPTQTSTEYRSFYEEIVELLPPKWYQLFIREQERRNIIPWSSTFNRAYSLRATRSTQYNKSISEPNQTDLYQSYRPQRQKPKGKLRRQSSVPETNFHTPRSSQESDIPVEGTRFRIARPSTVVETLENESEIN